MITFANIKVTANQKAKLEMFDALQHMLWGERLEYDDDLTEKELKEVIAATEKKLETVQRALGIDKLCKQIGLWQ